ncbi:hypothetical protein EON65_46650 [archaeon]|nr:MAG: hypothetical protein EON65_46650 [archaeon]
MPYKPSCVEQTIHLTTYTIPISFPLHHTRRVITTEEGQAFAEDHGLAYIETSAKSADGVDEAFLG